MTLENVVPWGRNLDEYRAMRLYGNEDGDKKILGCGDGPASVNTELSSAGVDIVSVDPVYRFSKTQIEKRMDETSRTIARQIRQHRDDYIWKQFRDVDALIDERLSAMRSFLDDFEKGKESGRYIDGALPRLPFADNTFDLAWSSHFLFLYSNHFSLSFHLASVTEMLRVAKEVRIFPLLDLENWRSAHLARILEHVAEKGCAYETVKTEYEFQKGAFEMLRILQN